MNHSGLCSPNGFMYFSWFTWWRQHSYQHTPHPAEASTCLVVTPGWLPFEPLCGFSGFLLSTSFLWSVRLVCALELEMAGPTESPGLEARALASGLDLRGFTETSVPNVTNMSDERTGLSQATSQIELGGGSRDAMAAEAHGNQCMP